MRGFPDLPPVWWLAAMAVIYIWRWAVPGLHIESVALDYASWALFASAIVLIAWSALWFWRKRTPIEPRHTPRALIVEGPYRLSRNPIYLALVLLTLASALAHGSVIGVATTIVLWAVLDRRFAAPEEAVLRETFGDEAEAFLAETRRWI